MTDRPYSFLAGDEPPDYAVIDSIPLADLLDGWVDIADEELNTHLNHWHYEPEPLGEEFTLSLRVCREDVEPMHSFHSQRKDDPPWCIEWYPSPDRDDDIDYLMVDSREEAIETAAAVMVAAMYHFDRPSPEYSTADLDEYPEVRKQSLVFDPSDDIPTEEDAEAFREFMEDRDQ